MKNNPMGKREKILVSLMALALAWGAWEVFFAGNTQERKNNFQTNAAVSADIAGRISREMEKAAIRPHEEYVLELAAYKWQRDPFYPLAQQRDNKTGNVNNEDENQAYHYTGFLEVGKKKMAIINGLEYQPGDEIEPGGAVLLGISPGQVEIRIKATGKIRILAYQN